MRVAVDGFGEETVLGLVDRVDLIDNRRIQRTVLRCLAVDVEPVVS
jgi:hypothetical protein